jgi:iduronate 2-sulfatase
LIIRVPGKQPAVCHSLVELIDLYPTTAALCGLEIPEHLQGRDFSALLDQPDQPFREFAFSVAPMRKGFLIREDRFALIQYREDASAGLELFDTEADPEQYRNLASDPQYRPVLQRLQQRLAEKLEQVRDHDLGSEG